MTEQIQIAEHSSRILFVDDDPLVARTFKRDIEASGDYTVSVANSGEDALNTISGETFGVVFSDFHMPGMNGIELLEQVRNASPDATRILVSGKGDFEMVVEVINRVGLFSFVSKPWDPLALKGIVERAMRRHKMIVDNRMLTGLLSEKVNALGRLNNSLESQVQQRTTNLLLGLINALDLRDTETQSHSRRVALYSHRLAEELDITGDDLLAVERGALLHDIGKIGVSDTILLKPGKLTDEEWVEMRKHSMHGYRILEGIGFLGEARRLVRDHHERWDGDGYPGKLADKEIYIGARIFAVVDTYDAMTTDRPYRKALPHEVADEEIEKMKGSQFDPQVVEAWKRIPQSDLQRLKEQAEKSGEPAW